MKKDIHPENYRPVVFKDMSNGDMFLSRSTCKTSETIEFEGETYPVVKIEISSSSHPFYTGGHGRSRRQVHEPLRKEPQINRDSIFYRKDKKRCGDNSFHTVFFCTKRRHTAE